MMANRVAIAVKLTERAEFPLAKCVIKLETLPPGQAATMIIPSAMLGAGSINQTKTNVKAGRSKNWLSTPTKTGLGYWINRLKSAGEISRATPNITKARAKFKSHKAFVSKLMCMVSRRVSVKLSFGY